MLIYSETRYDLLTIIERIKGSRLICRCDCGAILTVERNKLEQGQKRHCGKSECRLKLKEISKLYRGK